MYSEGVIYNEVYNQGDSVSAQEISARPSLAYYKDGKALTAFDE